ncbi:hypothetical protein BDV93DRAFT_454099, partial [Ceratobasidium sp. AG-I]
EQKKVGEKVTGPFEDQDEFEFVRWLDKHAISQGARQEFFELNIVSKLGLSFASNYLLNQKIDSLPSGPEWTEHSMTITGDKVDTFGAPLKETVTTYMRNPVDAIGQLLNNPMFQERMTFAPERVYTDASRESRVFDEMWTGDAWWRVQGKLPIGSTVVPVVLASDKTHLTNQMGGKEAWPVYLTIGNIPKDVRKRVSSHSSILIGYLPVTRLSIFKDSNRGDERLFHECMRILLKPLVDAGRNGVLLPCADGFLRKCFPVLMGYIADNPEQCLISCCKENRCHICTVHPNQRGDPYCSEMLNPSGEPVRIRDPQETIDLLLYYENGRHGAVEFENQGLKPFGLPFWSDLPHCNIYTCLAPDLLHQLHRGVFYDHVLSWCREVAQNDEEIDRRMAAIPSHPSLRHFGAGFSKLKQTTGTEHRAIEKVILGVLAGMVPNDVHDALQAILDFIYYAQLPVQNSTTLLLLGDALQAWHENKYAFVRLKIRDKLLFNVNKIHSMEHYVAVIKDLGTTDGYNTELPERLHIEYAKHAYASTNHKQFTKQMCTYLSRSEAVFLFDSYLAWATSLGGINFGKTCSKRLSTAPVLFQQSYLPRIQTITR